MFDPFDEKKHALVLHYAVSGMTKYYDALRDRFPDPEEMYERNRKGDSEFVQQVPEKIRRRLSEAAQPGFTEELFEKMDRIGCDVVVKGKEGYPLLLNEIDIAPNLLFVRGSLPENPVLPIAVIGSRKNTAYGRQVAETFSFGLCEQGALIVSGMAYGIDSAAAAGALESQRPGCKTIAVLGTGIDVIYPAENRSLYERIISEGAVVTEFWLGTNAKKENFPIRNRIMSGLSKGVLVVEAGEHSGTRHTVDYAHDQGREVFAVPGRITDLMSVGTNRMIRMGEAKPAFCIEDILEEFPGCRETAESPRNEKLSLSVFDAEQQRIIMELSRGELDADSLQEQTGMPVSMLNAKLTMLVFSGILRQIPGRVFSLDASKIDLGS